MTVPYGSPYARVHYTIFHMGSRFYARNEDTAEVEHIAGTFAEVWNAIGEATRFGKVSRPNQGSGGRERG